jgi:hypothetical protein
MSTFTEIIPHKPPIQLLPLVNENKKTTLLLIPRVDRLGTNLINYVSQIIHAYNNNWFIKYDPNMSYNNSIFVKCLMEYIDLYNETLERMYSDKVIEETEEIIICREHDVNYTTAFTVMHIQCDLITYFKKYIFPITRNINQLYIQPEFLIVSYNEANESFDTIDIQPIILKITIEQPSFVFVCTQVSQHGTK